MTQPAIPPIPHPIPNAARGEAVLHVDGRPVILCLTLGALARLEAAFEVDTLAALEARLRTLSSHDVLVIISALLVGPPLSAADLHGCHIHPDEAIAAIAKAFDGAGA